MTVLVVGLVAVGTAGKNLQDYSVAEEGGGRTFQLYILTDRSIRSNEMRAHRELVFSDRVVKELNSLAPQADTKKYLSLGAVFGVKKYHYL